MGSKWLFWRATNCLLIPALSDEGILFFCYFRRFEAANLKFIHHAVTATTNEREVL